MKKNLTKLFEGEFRAFEVSLDLFDSAKGSSTPLVRKIVVGTEQTVEHYIKNYLVPSNKDKLTRKNLKFNWERHEFLGSYKSEPIGGKSLCANYHRITKLEGQVDVLAVPMNTQAT